MSTLSDSLSLDLDFRHTPLIAAYLRGTSSTSLRKLADKTNYLEWYSNILNLLDKLRPMIFDVHYADAIIDILKSFFDFIQVSPLLLFERYFYWDASLLWNEDKYGSSVSFTILLHIRIVLVGGVQSIVEPRRNCSDRGTSNG